MGEYLSATGMQILNDVPDVFDIRPLIIKRIRQFGLMYFSLFNSGYINAFTPNQVNQLNTIANQLAANWNIRIKPI